MMSMIVQDVIVDACEGGEMSYLRSNSRPLVPGKEQRRSSTSVCSIGNHPNYKPYKHTLSKTRCSNSHFTDAAQTLVTPCGTPRKSNLAKAKSKADGKSMGYSCENLNAPLGFEPEGRVDIPPVFTEGSPPSYAKWAEGIDNLLSDITGINLFQMFLDDSGKHLLQFYFACKGFKSAQGKLKLKKDKISKFAKHIYQKFIDSGKVQLMRNTEQQLIEKLAVNTNDLTIYDDALEEVKSKMQFKLYPMFLKSDIYFQYVQKALESPNSSNNSGSSNGGQPQCQESGDVQLSKSLLKVLDASLSFSQKSSSCLKFPNDFSKDASYRNTVTESKSSLTNAPSLKEGLQIQPETQLCVEDYHSFIHKPSVNKHQSESLHDNRLAQKHPDLFYEKLNQRLKVLEQAQEEGKVFFTFETISDGMPPSHHNRSFQSSLPSSSNSVESLRACLANSDLSADADAPQSILDHHLSQTFYEDFAKRSGSAIGYSNKSLNSHFPNRQVNSSDESSYSKLQKYMERGFYSQENCSVVGANRGLHSAQSNPSLNSRTGSNQQDFKSFNPPLYLQQYIQSDLARAGSRCHNQVASLGKSSHGITKSKYYGRQYVSQSDSETADYRFIHPDSYTWKHSLNPASNRDQHLSNQCCCSQPDLHDPTRRRTMQYSGHVNKTMDPLLSHQRNHACSSQHFSVSSSDLHNSQFLPAELAETKRTSLSSMLPPTTFPLPRNHNPLSSSVSLVNANSVPGYPFRSLQSKELQETKMKFNRSHLSDTKSAQNTSTVVSYAFCDEPIPYRTTLIGADITLAQFRTYLAKKGNYRYYFMKTCDDFDSGIVFEEVFNDSDILPKCDGKVFAKIERQL